MMVTIRLTTEASKVLTQAQEWNPEEPNYKIGRKLGQLLKNIRSELEVGEKVIIENIGNERVLRN